MARQLRFPEKRCIGCNGSLEWLNELSCRCIDCYTVYDRDDLND